MNDQRYLRAATMSGKLRRRICRAIAQPMTAAQLARRLGSSLARCRKALLGLTAHRLMKCMTPKALRSRLFWLTVLGKRLRQELKHQAPTFSTLPSVEWCLYANVCFSQRSKVIQVLGSPMRPSEIKRKAARIFPGCRMSANNVRDVIRYLKRRGLARAVKVKKKRHPKYRLTTVGRQMRRLLLRVSQFPGGRDR